MEGILKGSRTSWIVSRALIAVGIVFFAVSLIYSYENTVFFIGSHIRTILLVIAAMLLCVAAAHAVTKWLTRKQFLLILLLVGIGLRLAWVLYIQTPPISDFLDMRNAGVAAVNGDYSIAQNDYFSRWVYLLGFSMFEGFIHKLFGSSLLILKIFNILFNVGTAVVVYFAASRVFNEFCGRIAALFYALYVPHIIMCSVLTNQHLSTFLFSCAFLLALRGRFSEKYTWIWIGLLLALGNMMRPLGVFFLIGVVVYALICKLWPTASGQRMPILARLVGIIAIYFIVMQVISYSFLWSGVTKHSFKSQEPYWKLMVGLNPQTTGGWSQEDTDYVMQYPLGKERNKASLMLLKERLQDKGQVMDLLVKKFKLMWGAEDSAPFWSLWEQNKPEMHSLLVKTERIMYMAMIVFSLLAFIILLTRKDYPRHFLFLLLLLGYALVHIAFEIQTRYRFDILPGMIILQSFGIYYLYSQVLPMDKKQPAALEV